MDIIQGKPLVSRFSVKAALGSSQSGQLFWATDTKKNNKDLLLRVIPRSSIATPHDLEELRQQVFRNIRLENPHIIRTIEFIDTPELLGYTAEYVAGDDLAQFADTCALSLIKRLWIALSISKTVLVLHESGIHHGAVTVENVIFRKGSFKLCEPLVLVSSEPAPLTQAIRAEVTQVGGLIARLVQPLFGGKSCAHLKRLRRILKQTENDEKIDSLASLNLALEGLITRILETPRRYGSYLVLGIALMLVSLMLLFSTTAFSNIFTRIANQVLWLK